MDVIDLRCGAGCGVVDVQLTFNAIVRVEVKLAVNDVHVAGGTTSAAVNVGSWMEVIDLKCPPRVRMWMRSIRYLVTGHQHTQQCHGTR